MRVPKLRAEKTGCKQKNELRPLSRNSLSITKLICSDAVKAGIRRDAAYGANIVKGAVWLDGKNADCAVSGVQRVKKFAIGADCDVQICRSGRIASDNSAWQSRQGTVCRDRKPSNVRRCRIRVVDETSVRGDCVPAICVAQRRNTRAEGSKRSIRRNRIRRNGRSIKIGR